MDKEGVDREFEGLLIFNDIDLDTDLDDDDEVNMSVVEMSSIVQDLNSMMWFMQEVMTRVYEDRPVSVDVEVIRGLRKIQEHSLEVIEGFSFIQEDED